ncbi:MAG: HD-GYP domain-containing protein [Thermotogota bacterium]
MKKYNLKNLLYKKPLIRNLIFLIVIILVMFIMYFVFFEWYTKKVTDYYVSELEIYTEILENDMLEIYEDNKEKIRDLTEYYSNDLESLSDLGRNIEQFEDFQEINYYLINENGVIYETDYEEDLGYDLKTIPDFWPELKNELNEQKILIQPIGMDSADGHLRIFSYTKLANGNILEMGFKLRSCFLCDIINFCENDSKLPFLDYIGLYNFQKVPLTDSFKDFDFSIFGDKIKKNNEKGFFKRYNMRVFSSNVFGNYKLQWLILVEYDFFYSLYILLSFIVGFSFYFIYLITKNKKTNDIVYDDLKNLHKVSDNMSKDNYDEFINSIKTREIKEIKDVLISSKEEIQTNTEELISNNEELENTYKTLEKTYNNFDLVLDVFSNLSDDRFDEKKYLKKIIDFIKNYIHDSIYVAILVKSQSPLNNGYIFHYKNKDFEDNFVINNLDTKNICTGESIYNLLDNKNPDHKKIKNHIDDAMNKFCYPIINNKPIGYIFIGFEENYGSEKEIINQITKIFKSYYLMKKYTYEESNLKMRILKVISKTLDYYDSYTKGHSDNVAIYSFRIANEMGLDEKTLDKIYWAGILHDVGKIFVSQSTLNKNGKLTDEEYEEIKKHPEKSFELISSVEGLEEYAEIVRYHHERYDGKGYPKGIKKDKIPKESRILAVADSMDAMLSTRPYKKAKNLEEALIELENNKGLQFDPQIVDIAKKINWNI